MINIIDSSVYNFMKYIINLDMLILYYIYSDVKTIFN